MPQGVLIHVLRWAAALAAGIVAAAAPAAAQEPFQRTWVYVSETSAVVYWQLSDIRSGATSRVEYGKTAALGSRTEDTKEPRWAQFHRLTGLEPDTAYHYCMVVTDAESRRETRSADLTLKTRKAPGAVRIPQDVSGPPFVLDRAGATYLVTQDLAADGDAFVIAAPDVTLDLDGHTVVFGNNTADLARGVWAKHEGKATIANGHLVQGARSAPYSAAVESRWRGAPTEIFAISTDVHLPCAYPIKFLGKAADTHIHHCVLASRVTELESRHYPGNDLLRLDVDGGSIDVHDNLLTGGCHVGVRLDGKGEHVNVSDNDICHHQQYVNGYALALACPGALVHHNRVTSCGRGAHLTADGIELYDNYLDLYGHQQLDDMPAKSRPFQFRLVELHGIKFEGKESRHCKVHGNFVRIVQKQPRDSGGQGSPDGKIASGVYVRSRATALGPDRLADAAQRWEPDRWRGYWVRYAADQPPALITGNDATTLFGEFKGREAAEYAIYQAWQYVPATPLNLSCEDPDAMNEVYDNTFVALTTYSKARHGPYGRAGEWAAALYLVGMDLGPAAPDRYAAYVHDNRFVSNDAFVGSEGPVTATVRIERNAFRLAGDPPPTEGHTPFWRHGADLEAKVKAGGNTFQEP
jgi:hypothetical protein